MRDGSRKWWRTAAGLLAWALWSAAAAQEFPVRPVRVIVGAGPGSVPDSVARLLAEALTAAWGQPLRVENRPGAGGITAMESLVRSAPDGYTVALATMSQLVFNPWLYRNLPYDPDRDLAPIVPLVSAGQVIAVHPSVPATTLGELVAFARREAKPLQYGVAYGAPPHVTALRLWQQAGVTLEAVPFKTGPEAITAAVGAHVRIVVDGPAAIAPQVRAGRLRALAMTGPVRAESLPDVATAAEQGIGDASGEAWIGLVAPAGTPRPVIDRWQSEVARVLAAEPILDAYRRLGMRALSGSTDAFTGAIREDRLRWGETIRATGLKLD
jgi:tripartite-type tricarboxylate transporter receptor subunit TctC